MYDKSKKTWSQRLKITKSEKNESSPAAAAIATAPNNAHISHNPAASQYQPATATTMHMQALQLQQLSDYHNGGGGGGAGPNYEYLPSALSRSMKYAEPWIYGTVRGIPARPYHHYHQQAASVGYAHPHAAAIFAAHPLATSGTHEAIAVVICSCPEYLNGTKRDVKKASVCKKCKGSRLPLATIGGTMRLPTSSGMLAAQKLRNSGAATMRVVSSTKKARPTILDPQKDPYDMMRRTRLLSPEPGAATTNTKEKEKSRGRGKSASPVRGRSRKRAQLPPPPKKAAGRPEDTQDLPDCWLVEDNDSLASGNVTPTASSRRSILRCNVNPYDLISIKSSQAAACSLTTNAGTITTPTTPTRGKLPCSQNEFMPPNYDFNVEDAALTEEAPPFARHSRPAAAVSSSINQPKSPKTPQRKSLNGGEHTAQPKGIKSDERSAPPEATSGQLNYANVQAIAGQRISLGEHKPKRKSLIKQSEDGSCYESIIIGGEDDTVGLDKGQRTAAEEAKPKPSEKQPQPKRPPRIKKQESSECMEVEAQKQQQQQPVTITTNRQDTTKTIVEVCDNVTVLTVTPTQHIKSILKRPSSKTSDVGGELTPDDSRDLSLAKALKDAKASTPTYERRTSKDSAANSITPSTPTGTSQFYIPMPQARKKVQFMVENRVIHTSSESLEDADEPALDVEDELLKAAGINYEYYIRKREQQRVAAGEASTTVNATSSLSHAAAQAALLAALQYDSALVSSALNAVDTKNHANNSNAHNVATTSEDEAAAACAHLPLTNTKADMMHYEDVIPVVTATTTTSQQQQQLPSPSPSPQQQQRARADDGNDSGSNCKIMSDTSIKLLLAAQRHAGSPATSSSSPTSTMTTATAAAKAALLSPTSTALASSPSPSSSSSSSSSSPALSAQTSKTAATVMSHVIAGVDDVLKAEHAADTATTTTTTTVALAATPATTTTATTSAGDYDDDDDDAKRKKHRLQAVAASDSGKTQATQSRNPIRRAHSERQPTHNKLTNMVGAGGGATHQAAHNYSDTESCSGGTILHFKDTMALRMKNSRNDTRDLFCRPREPPPPPPPATTAAVAASGEATTATAQNTTKECSGANATAANASPLTPTGQIRPATDMDSGALHATTGGNSKAAAVNRLDSQQQLQHNTATKNQRNLLNNGGTTSSQAFNSKNAAVQPMAAEATVGNTRELPAQRNNNHNGRTKPQRTVVRVAPFNKNTSEVHRLTISHTDHVASDATCLTSNAPYSFQYTANGCLIGEAGSQQKTSILISGDDCYSTMNLSCDDAATPLYQSSVVVADYSTAAAKSSEAAAAGTTYAGLKVTNTSNTVTINVSSPRSYNAEEELIHQHNKINTLLTQAAKTGAGRAIIPIKGTTTTIAAEVSLQRSASSTSSTSTSSMTSISSSGSGSGSASASASASGSACGGSIPKRGRTLIKLDYDKEKRGDECTPTAAAVSDTQPELLSHEEELLKILRNPVEAVKRNLVPHICGRNEAKHDRESVRNKKMQQESCVESDFAGGSKPEATSTTVTPESTLLRKPSKAAAVERNSFISKLLEDPMLSQVADGLEAETIAELIENSLKRLRDSRNAIDITGTKDSDDMSRLINLSLQKIKEERQATATAATPHSNSNQLTVPTKDEDRHSNRGSISSANSFASANNYEMFDFDANESDCYQSCSSEITSPGDDDASSASTRSKFYQMLVDATLAEIEMSTNLDEDIDEHHYESIRNNGDPIYEEITDVPPPLPLSAPPLNDAELEKKAARSIFEGASKYDILSYLVDAKERGLVREESFEYPVNTNNPIIIEEEATDTLSDLGKRKQKKDLSSRASVLSDSSEDNQSTMSSLSPPPHNFICGSGGANLLQRKGAASDIERNDSGVGSETSKSSRSKYQIPLMAGNNQLSKNSPIHLCEDCDGPVETQVTDSGIMFAPLVCRKCGKKRVERKEIITEIVETEEKYGRDLQIILEEFCHPMLVAGLLTQEQLSAIFLNTEELLENNQTLAERMRDALDIALEQGDDDLLTVNIGKIFLDFTQMLHAFESYCVRQAGASLLLANLEKEKELLRIFLKVSQMENAVLRRMNLNSFLMVPVQRVTKYPLLLARLYKVTPAHLEGRDQLKQAQEKIELHLNHINQEAKDVPTKLWRRISSSSPNRRASCEIDMINIKLRKMAIDILEWNHDEVRFAMEGKLLYTQPTDSNWKKARTIKLTPVNALLVTNGKPSANYKAEKVMSDKLNFPKHTGIREASLLLVKEKCGRYTLIREPLYLDRCVVCSEADWDDYFEVQEISSKDTFIFKAEDGVRTKQWYTQLQYHAQGMGAWRKRRNALANIMINGMLARS